MRHLIGWVLLRALVLWLPARGQHRPAVVSETAPEAPPLHICGWEKPIHPHHLVKTMPPVALGFWISPVVLRWERLPEEVQQAELKAHAEAAWPQWLKTRAAVERSRQTPEDEKRRRVELFATAYDLPSPLALAGAMG
ncbi:hypothetical protein [Kitasatospora sp. NPDC091276]|uniref:hypothetical protein n=1 Tax=Kitasatospora sp. NPDC091276 TaxID=3155300 RepID=UPI0034190B43